MSVPGLFWFLYALLIVWLYSEVARLAIPVVGAWW